MKLQENLKRLRTIKGLTQNDLADFLQINRTTYANYEQGRREPDYITISKLADFYDVSIDLLLGRKENEKYSEIEKQLFFKTPMHQDLFQKLNTLDQDDIYLLNNFVEKIMEKNYELREKETSGYKKHPRK